MRTCLFNLEMCNNSTSKSIATKVAGIAVIRLIYMREVLSLNLGRRTDYCSFSHPALKAGSGLKQAATALCYVHLLLFDTI